MDLRYGIKILSAAVAAVVVVLVSSCENPSGLNESTPNVKHITQGEFGDEVTRCTQPAVAEFYATWCGPCQQEGPLLDKVAGGYTNRVKFVKVNVDESPGLAQNYDAEILPLVLLFKDGKLAGRLVGPLTEMDLTNKLSALVAVNAGK